MSSGFDWRSFLRYPRRLQFDDFSCAARATQSVLAYYGKGDNFASIKRELGTSEEGTSMAPVERLLRKRGLAVTRHSRMTMRDLERGLAHGVVIVSVDSDHVAVVHDIDPQSVHIADPAPNRCLGNTQPRASFRRRWDRSGLVVTDRVRGRPTPPLHVPLTVDCPFSGNSIPVDNNDGNYECPDCKEDIEVENDEATHVELDIFDCPATGSRAVVPAEELEDDEYFVCPECGSPVQSLAEGGSRWLMHAVEFD